ncbi:hypothetical protein MJO28_003217 [Puccinia striiformis f. sp. tritici]|uniref:Uncharacterized protein n=1 Tax=Puccinia striiformis f. sp. tritici TaxID=168172 RepID=A0ACC0ERT9_9BASI|nr:hypothetical protein MJO29_008171 [Puccinia striiformis f. sp. tritici]KAI7959426.1 hypothetical protein MJO28_003217 [Puccinia striiformis f. sp. tritici]
MVAPVENPQGNNLFQQTQETGPDYTNIIRWLGLDLVGQQNSQTNFISVFLIVLLEQHHVARYSHCLDFCAPPGCQATADV